MDVEKEYIKYSSLINNHKRKRDQSSKSIRKLNKKNKCNNEKKKINDKSEKNIDINDHCEAHQDKTTPTKANKDKFGQCKDRKEAKSKKSNIKVNTLNISKPTKYVSYIETVKNIAKKIRTKELKDLVNKIEVNPKNPDYFFEIGKILYIRLKESDAEKCFRICIKLSPRNLKAKCYLGLILSNQGYGRSATEILKFTEAKFSKIRKCNFNSEYYSAYGLVLRELGKFELSDIYLQEAVKLFPKDPLIHFHFARNSELLERYGIAEKYYKLALKLDPKFSKAMYNLGYLYYAKSGENRKKKKKGEQLFLDTLSINPTFYYASNCLGCLKMNQGEYEEAEIYFKKTIKINPNYIHTYRNYIELLLIQKREAEIILMFQDAIKKSSLPMNLYTELGVTIMTKGLMQFRHIAEYSFKKSTEIETNTSTIFNLIVFYYHDNRNDKSERLFKKYKNKIVVDNKLLQTSDFFFRKLEKNDESLKSRRRVKL